MRVEVRSPVTSPVIPAGAVASVPCEVLRNRRCLAPFANGGSGDGRREWAGRPVMLLRACAWCERIHVDGRWLEATAAIRHLRAYEWSEPPTFTHERATRASPGCSA